MNIEQEENRTETPELTGISDEHSPSLNFLRLYSKITSKVSTLY